MNARDRHFVMKLDFAYADTAGNWGRRRRIGSGGQREMTFGGEQAGGGIESNPACTREIDLGPGMKVGEILRGSMGSLKRLDGRLQLDEITGHEAGGESQVPQQLDEQPGRVT